MSIKHEVRLNALEVRCSALESRLELLEAMQAPAPEVLTGATGGGFCVQRRPGRYPRYDVTKNGIPINTNPLTLEEAEAMVGEGNAALEGTDVA